MTLALRTERSEWLIERICSANRLAIVAENVFKLSETDSASNLSVSRKGTI